MLTSVGVKAWSGKEDTTLLSMADCRVKQSTVSTATRYGIKPRIQGCPRGSVRMGGGSKDPILKIKKVNKKIAEVFAARTSKLSLFKFEMSFRRGSFSV